MKTEVLATRVEPSMREALQRLVSHPRGESVVVRQLLREALERRGLLPREERRPWVRTVVLDTKREGDERGERTKF